MTIRKGAFRRYRHTDKAADHVIEWLADGDHMPWMTLISQMANEVEPAWNQYREDILEVWIADYPGSRPRAWWLFDAPTPLRRRLDGPPEVLRKSDHGIWWERDFGIPKYGIKDAQYESETDYLIRHGLLSPEERDRLKL